MSPTVQQRAGQGGVDRGLTHILPVSCIEPQDVSDAILYLVSDTGHDTTGSPIVLDAGIRRRVFDVES